MWRCHYCRVTLSLEVQRKNRLCPNCNSDLHACRNCIHFDESITAKCKEPHSEWVSDRVAQNNCTFFEFRPEQTDLDLEASAADATSEAERAKEAFRALFRTP